VISVSRCFQRLGALVATRLGSSQVKSVVIFHELNSFRYFYQNFHCSVIVDNVGKLKDKESTAGHANKIENANK